MISITKCSTPHFMHSLLNTYSRFEKTAMAQATILENQTTFDFEEMRRLENEKQGKIVDLSKAITAKKNWGMVSFAAQTAITGSNLVLGAVSLAKENTRSAGMCMLASGVASIASQVFSYTGFFKKISSWATNSGEMQEKIASRLEVGMQCFSSGLGIMGAITAYRNGTLTDAFSQAQSWMSSPLLSLGSRMLECREKMFHREADHTRGFLMESESLIMQIYQRIHQTSKDAERLLHTIGDICEALKQAVSSLHTRI